MTGLARSAPTMLWLPGWGMDAAVFDGLRARLPQFRHAAVPLGAAGSAQQLYELAAGAARASASPGGGPLIAAGWSLGGLLALALAAEGLADGLVLIGATARFARPRGETDLGWPDGYVRQMAAALKQNRETTEQRFRDSIFTLGERDRGLPALLSPPGSWTDAGLLAGLELLRREDARPTLSRIGCPALIIHGRADTICPFGAALELQDGLSRAELSAVQDGGHAPFLGRESTTAEAIGSWWNDKSRR